MDVSEQHSVILEEMNEDAFEEEILAAIPKMRRFARKLHYNQIEPAEELLQDTLLRVLSKKHRYQSNGSQVSTWAITVMNNLHIDHFRKNGNKQEVKIEIEDRDTGQFGWLPEDSGMIDSEYIINHVNKLAPKQREIILMLMEGYKYEEIADKVGYSLGTIKSQIFHARQTLSSKLKAFRS